jgi:hypothetical protein
MIISTSIIATTEIYGYQLAVAEEEEKKKELRLYLLT